MPTVIATIRDELATAEVRLATLVARADQFTPEERREYDALLPRVAQLRAQVAHAQGETLDELRRYIHPAAGVVPSARALTLGAAVRASDGFKALLPTFPIEGPYRTVFEVGGAGTAATAALYAAVQLPPPLPMPGTTPAPPPAVATALRVSQLLPHVGIDDVPIVYWQYKSKGTGAGVVPTGQLKPVFVLDRERKTGDLVTIASTLVVNDSELEDNEGLEASLNSEMAYDVLMKLDNEILLGDGTGGRWIGLMAGATGPTHAVGAGEAPLDAINAAAAAVADASGRPPDGIVMNAATYAASVAVKAQGGGGYLVPPVAMPVAVFPGTTLRLALNSELADGAALLGSFGFGAKLDVKGRLRMDVSNSSGDLFIRNQSVLRVELRCFLAITRPLSFAKVTGLPPATP
jgi:hypothetical protein